MRLIILVLLLAAPLANADIFIKCPRLLNGESETLFENKTIQVKGNRIESVHDGRVSGSANDQNINLVDATCMPGLIDAHVHITSQQSPNRFSIV